MREKITITMGQKEAAEHYNAIHQHQWIRTQPGGEPFCADPFCKITYQYKEDRICGSCKEPYEEANEYGGFCSYDCLQTFNLD